MSLRQSLKRVFTLASFAILLSSASAAAAEHSGVPSGLSKQLDSAHFVIHYTTSGSKARRVSTSRARRILETAESAYSIEVGRWGYPAPIPDSDGKIDLYVYKCSGLGTTHADNKSAATSSAWICLRPKVPNPTVAHELFHAIQYAISRKNPRWLREATAETAEKLVGAEIDGTAFKLDAPAFALFPEISLDCSSKACFGKNTPYRQWPFFNYIIERYGEGIVKDIFQRTNDSKDGLTPIDAALKAHGISLEQAYLSYVRTVAVGNFGFKPLVGTLPKFAHEEKVTPTSKFFPPYRAAVDHLAAQFIRFVSSPSQGTGCGPRPLRIMVTTPKADSPIESGFASNGREGKPSTVSRERTIYTLPWDACVEHVATLALINNGTKLDKRGVRVTMSFGDTVPTLNLVGPNTVSSSSSQARLAFSINSSLEGSVDVSLGKGKLRRTLSVVQGRNNLSLLVPPKLRNGSLEVSLTPRSVTYEPGSATRFQVKYE